MSKITKEEIEHLAKLSRIELSSGEAENLAKEVDSILGYVGQIKEVKGNIEREVPTLRNVMREDVVTNTPGEHTGRLLDGVPSREGNYLKVKKIL